MSDLVSIIIPCYNAKEYLGHAIESALDQDYPNCEVIVIDDGSKDSSRSVIESFGGRIRARFGPNRGGCAARNQGIAMAEGTWIQFLDADDVLTPKCVSVKLTKAKATTDEKIVFCSQIEAMVPLDTATPSPLPSHWNKEQFSIQNLIVEGVPATPSPLHRIEQLKEIGGFREGLPSSQEYDLHLRLALILGCRFVMVPEIGCRVRILGNSVSRKRRLLAERRRVEILTQLGSELELTQEIQSAFAQSYVAIARRLWKGGERAKSKEVFKMGKNLSGDWWKGVYRSKLSMHACNLLGFQTFEQLHRALSSIRR